MAWTTEEKLRLAEILVVLQLSRSVMNRLLSGKITRAENQVMKGLLRTGGRIVAAEARGLGRLAVRGIPVAARGLAFAGRTNPYTLAASLAIVGYIKREEIADVARAVADDPRVEAVYEDILAGGQAALGTAREAAIHTYGEDLSGLTAFPSKKATKRRISKANKAVKQGMKWLKEGGKAVSGAPIGVVPKLGFKIATIAAGLANPNTKSKPGKGKSIMNKLARRLKKWW